MGHVPVRYVNYVTNYQRIPRMKPLLFLAVNSFSFGAPPAPAAPRVCHRWKTPLVHREPNSSTSPTAVHHHHHNHGIDGPNRNRCFTVLNSMVDLSMANWQCHNQMVTGITRLWHGLARNQMCSTPFKAVDSVDFSWTVNGDWVTDWSF